MHELFMTELLTLVDEALDHALQAAGPSAKQWLCNAMYDSV